MNDLKSIYFLGIGGIGMSALARYFKLKGASVTGYDKTPSPLTDELISEGISIHYTEDISMIPKDTELVIYTPAVPKDHSEYQYFLKSGILMKKRSEVLGMITEGIRTAAVAGTHGKTTVSTLLAHIFKSSGKKVTAFLGGISKNYQTNFLYSEGAEIIVAEADEFDRSFLTLYPDTAIITSTDPDHLDIYGNSESLKKSFKEFSSHIKKEGHLIVKNSLLFNAENKNGYHVKQYGLTGNGYSAMNLRIENGRYIFDLCYDGNLKINDLSPGLPGLFNVENTIAASAAALENGVTSQEIKKAVASYEGVVRRFDFHIRRNDFVYIDDYAHHPAELTACIDSLKKLYPEKKITGVFQPHLFTRTRDFAKEFAESLSMLDSVILLDIYPAREEPIPGISSSMLLEKITIGDKMLCQKQDLIKVLKDKKPEVLVTLGAGDIDRLVGPITGAFE